MKCAIGAAARVRGAAAARKRNMRRFIKRKIARSKRARFGKAVAPLKRTVNYYYISSAAARLANGNENKILQNYSVNKRARPK